MKSGLVKFYKIPYTFSLRIESTATYLNYLLLLIIWMFLLHAEAISQLENATLAHKSADSIMNSLNNNFPPDDQLDNGCPYQNFLYFNSGTTVLIKGEGYSYISTFSIQPFRAVTGTGLEIGIVHLNRFHNHSIYSLLPSITFQNRKIGVKLGLNTISDVFDEEGPHHLTVPAIEFKVGNPEKMFVSFGFFSNIFPFPYALKINYIFNDYKSHCMIGMLFYDLAEEYYCYCYRVDWSFYHRLYFIFHGQIFPEEHKHGIQIGLGYAL